MKRIIFMVICAVAILATSCTTTFQAVSLSSLKAANVAINDQLSDLGFQLSGQSNETKNEVSVTGTSYSRYTGYGTSMKNNYFQYQEYSFVDSADNNVSYVVKYQLKKDINGKEYVENLELTNCNANKKYNTVCGPGGIVKGNIQKVAGNPDIQVTETDSMGVILGITCGSLGACAIILLLALII